MKIAFVRHGETTLNQQGKMTGRLDVPLNVTGHTQAAEASMLLDTSFDVIFSSSLQRSLQTATVIAERLNVPLVVENAILERDFGSLSGKTWEEINVELGFDAKKADKEQRYDYRPFGGESAEQVRERLTAFIGRVKKGHHQRPLIVCHGGIIRMLHHAHQNEVTPIANASVHEFDL